MPRSASLSDLADPDLVALTLDGDEQAFAVLMRRHEKRVRSMLFRLVKNRETAEDLSQETFSRAFTELKSHRRESNFANWLFRIANNLGMDYLRQQRRKKHTKDIPLDEVEEIAPSGASSIPGLRTPPPEPRARKRVGSLELSPSVAGALEGLRPPLRRCFLLWYEGVSYDEMSRITGLPRGTVAGFIHRTRAKLKKEFRSRRK
ncbi:MAG: sigma-70 family RNA polymerase sigma factor [Gemmatimonadetes bacterium]|nr:sigma-70 family RNA polymerase sigma factor [Gemmatimonadota bacterium]